MRFWNKKTKCKSNHIHDSQGEARYCNKLRSDLKAGLIQGYRVQVPFDLGQGITHVPDFLVSTSTLTVHEFKGCITETWKHKYWKFLTTYPQIGYMVIRYNE